MNSSDKVQYWYFRFFRRNPDPGGQDYWTNRLIQGEDSSNVLSDFLAAEEYYTAAGGTPQAYIRQLACDLHSHLPDSDQMIALMASLADNAITRQEAAAEMILHA